jgi:hypothetical protein
MPTDYEFFTDAQRLSRLPKRPWHINVYENSGSTNYQVQASDGDVIANLGDDDYDGPGAARAIAESIVKWANAEAESPPPPSQPPSTSRGHLRLV